jgi:hypothetical protein
MAKSPYYYILEGLIRPHESLYEATKAKGTETCPDAGKPLFDLSQEYEVLAALSRKKPVSIIDDDMLEDLENCDQDLAAEASKWLDNGEDSSDVVLHEKRKATALSPPENEEAGTSGASSRPKSVSINMLCLRSFNSKFVQTYQMAGRRG